MGLATDLEAADLEPRVTAEALKSGAPTGLVAAQTEWETGICHAPRAETGTPSVAAPKASMEGTRERTATAVLPAWGREAAVLEGVVEVADLAVVAVAAAAVDGADQLRGPETGPEGSADMKLRFAIRSLSRTLWPIGLVLCACVSMSTHVGAQQFAGKAPKASSGVDAKRFATAQQAADALVDAAEDFDVTALEQIFGRSGNDLVFLGEYEQDRERAAKFAAEAREKKAVSVDPRPYSAGGTTKAKPPIIAPCLPG